ncbi:hypothetical protein DKP76_00490 [Falsochrobactrum shanghaiense]|uniref:Thiol:disulfide interchange protein DsbD N-terminal domain-containing protein n=1 Tax=Falsochrobactrum shanghaiense TaxID=2201899 RepID=A0A316JE30_9HYPH|nr:protein-disulfide reductase DsbD domain-containing protein [Falsochrobactrum shanghaiense]PWL19716.1 hypothetical protein DKP76_00490 [Falsochrobactrum shanghaiense]
MKIKALPLLPIVFLALLAPAQASTSDWTQTPGGRVRVLIDDHSAVNGQLRGALQIELQPGWKTYWRNPGDSGVPPQLSLAGNGEARIDFPVPERFGAGDEAGVGYTRPVSLPLTFTVSPGDKRLSGNIFLGICENICVPVHAEFDLPLVSQTAPSPQAIAARTIVQSAFDRLPQAASPDFRVSEARRQDDRILFELDLPDSATPAQLFVASDALSLSEAVPQQEAARPQFAAKIYGKAKEGAVIDYTLVQNGKAVSGTIKLN